jgi:gamma-glutamyl-gamma-aminobutyrate hydrolase PuuD/enamine deaminase RidA (YjgF/YER057c/UK114 family)
MMKSSRDEGGAARRPVVLMTPDIEGSASAPTEKAYVVRVNYAEAIQNAGGIPLILPYNTQSIGAAVELADGVVITGARPGVEVWPERRAFELKLVEHVLKAGKPLLGICHGMQLIGEWLGGTFVKSLPAQSDGTVEHMPSNVPDRLAHSIAVEPGSKLGSILGHPKIEVNSLHQHALTGAGRFHIAARATDGVIEAFEGDTPGFCLGVQWHPEYSLTDFDRAIFRLFLDSILRKRTAETCSTVRERLAALDIALPDASNPPGAFVGAIRVGDTVTVSGQVPLKDKAVLRVGHLGEDVSLEDGRECARWALLNALAQLESIAGRLDRVKGFVRLAGYVASTPDFTQHGAVVDGASELLRAIFPQCWSHARIAVGVGSLPRGVPVEIELTAILDDVEA